MEFLHTKSRYNGSENSSSADSKSKRNNVGLLIVNDKPVEETHIVFSTRNLTDSMTKINKVPSSTTSPSTHNSTPQNSPSIGMLSPTLSQKSCLLSSHGLRRGNSGSLKPGRFDHTLNLLPLTVCTKHGTTGFLPYDYVRRMAEYTRTTAYTYPVSKVVHSYDDCILEFPLPPPIGSSEEECMDCDYSRHCYQCLTALSSRKTVYMYRDYLFCCHGCRLKACAAKYWYTKLMMSRDDDDDERNDLDVNEAEIFTIDP